MTRSELVDAVATDESEEIDAREANARLLHDKTVHHVLSGRASGPRPATSTDP